MINKMKVLLAPALLAVALPAQAVLIDFTSTEWAGVNGEQTYTNDVAGIGDVTLRANVGTLTFNGNEGPGAIGGLVGDGDGIGIKKYGDRDEINNPQGGDKIEKLTVTFDASVVIDEILVLDLFNNEYLGYRLKPGPYADSPFIPAGPGSAGGAGFLSIFTGFDSTDRTSWIQFTVPQGAGDDSDQDFALAGLRVTAVPEPSTLALLGLGFLGLARIRKRV